MAVIIGLVISFLSIVFCIYFSLPIWYGLFVMLIVFSIVAVSKGFKFKEILIMQINGILEAKIIFLIFILIGIITATWIISGTIPALIFYGLKMVGQNSFYLQIFIITCAVSSLLGTALGTASTIGIVFMLITRISGGNILLAAGAIMSGAYFGDRCSPMSSSAILVSTITKSNLYTNILNMIKTSIMPFILSCIIYFVLSYNQPLSLTNTSLQNQITEIYNVNIVVLFPALLIVLLAVLKVPIYKSMAASIISAVIIGVTVQDVNFVKILESSLIGYYGEKEIYINDVIKGGGIVSMVQAGISVCISCAMAGVFRDTKIFRFLETNVENVKSEKKLINWTLFYSILSSCFGCNQTISIILTNNWINKGYKNKNQTNGRIALDIENTSVLVAALIPWNVAAVVPIKTLGIHSYGYIPYAFYLYLLPIIYTLFYYQRQHKNLQKVDNPF